MQTDTVGISSVVPYARNPRRNEAAIAKVAASLIVQRWEDFTGKKAQRVAHGQG